YTAEAFDFDNLPIEDRWILGLLAETSNWVTGDLEQFRFAEASKRIRDFTWNDFCDWYVEFVKGRLRDPKARPDAQRTLTTVLDGICRLLHPIPPFVTEQVWQALREVAPERMTTSPRRPDVPKESVCMAEWPDDYPAAWWAPNDSGRIEARWV